MSALVPLLGSFVAAILAVVVYTDATRRGLPARSRTRWTAGVGLGSLAGVLGAWLFDAAIVRLYLHTVRSEPVVHHPREPLAVTLAAGLAVAVAAVLSYHVGTRTDAPA